MQHTNGEGRFSHSSPPLSLVTLFVLNCLLALFTSNLSVFAFKPFNINHEFHAPVYFKPTTFILLLLLALMALITLPPSSKLNPPSLLKTGNPTKPISKFKNPTISTPKTHHPFPKFKLSSIKPHQNHLNKKWGFSCSAALHNEAELRPFSHKILLSDVVVKEPKRVFKVERKWNVLDSATLSVVVAMHLLALFVPFNFNWGALWVALALYVATGLFGICLSFHRNLSHRSFKLPKWLEYLCAYCGILALQGNPIDWVSTHRYHHQYCDSEKDPHSPLEGFWFSHMFWLFDTTTILQRRGEPSNVADLEKQAFYRLMKSTYVLHPLALGALLYAFGGFPYIVWGMGVRTIWVYHITWLVNSACHVWGNQAWNTGDLSRNNWWVALLSFGEGWHNNHHAFEYSARHGLEWWQIDATWYAVRLLQAIGLARDVKLPTEAHKQKMAFKR